MSTTNPDSTDTNFLATVGQTLIDLANEWENAEKSIQKVEEPGGPIQGLMRDAYGALALALGRRAGDLQRESNLNEDFQTVLNEVRANFAKTMGMIIPKTSDGSGLVEIAPGAPEPR